MGTETNWIEAVVRVNTDIVAAEERVNAKVAELFAMVMEGRETVEGEALLVSYGQDLVRLRAIQAEQLQNVGTGG